MEGKKKKKKKKKKRAITFQIWNGIFCNFFVLKKYLSLLEYNDSFLVEKCFFLTKNILKKKTKKKRNKKKNKPHQDEDKKSTINKN